MARVVKQLQFGTWKYRWLKSGKAVEFLTFYEIHRIRDENLCNLTV